MAAEATSPTGRDDIIRDNSLPSLCVVVINIAQKFGACLVQYREPTLGTLGAVSIPGTVYSMLGSHQFCSEAWYDMVSRPQPQEFCLVVVMRTPLTISSPIRRY